MLRKEQQEIMHKLIEKGAKGEAGVDPARVLFCPTLRSLSMYIVTNPIAHELVSDFT